MNIAIEEVSSCRRRLRIEVPASDVDTEINKITLEFQKLAQIKGFRAGKAPRAVVEKKYSKDIEEEVKRKIIPQAFREAIKTKNLKVVSAPQIEELHFQRGVSLSFSTVVDLVPEFSLPEYKGLKIKKIDVQATDEDVQKVIDNVLEQHADYKTIEGRAIAEKDFAIVSYEGTIDGNPIEALLPEVPTLSKRENFWLLIQEGIFLPNFPMQLVGLNVGESKTVTIKFPDDFPHEVLRGREAVYQVKIQELKEKTLPAFDEDMAQKLAQTSVEELKNRVRENIMRDKKQRAESEQVKELLDQLKAAVSFELPESAVENQTERAVFDIVKENQMRGIPDTMLEEHKADIYKAAQASALEQVKIGFILSKISEIESIKAEAADVIQVIQSYAAQEKMAVDKMIKQLRENNGIEQIEEEIRNRKTVQFLLQSAIME